MTWAQWVIILQMCTLSQPRQFVIFGICVLGKGTPTRARSLIYFLHTLLSTHAELFHLQSQTWIFGICVLEKGARARARSLSLFLCLSVSERKRQRTRKREREREKETEWGRERKRTLSLFHSLFLSLSLSFIHVTYCTPQPVSALAFSLEDLLCTCSHIHLVGYGVATVSRIKLLVSFAEYCLFYRALFQKRPMI